MTAPDALMDAYRAAPFRSVMWRGMRPGVTLADAPPLAGAVYLDDPGSPTGAEMRDILATAGDAFAAGGSFLLMATRRDLRDAVKAAIAAVHLVPHAEGGAVQ